jgi:uncharacterized protein YecT (DUF1311 family)
MNKPIIQPYILNNYARARLRLEITNFIRALREIKIKIFWGIAFSCLALTGCINEIPKCSDERTIILLKDALTETLGIENLKDNIVISDMRPTGLNKSIKKYSCEATLRNLTSGNQQQFASPIKYESQVNDDGEHLVLIANLDSSLGYVVSSIMINAVLQQKVPDGVLDKATPKPIVVNSHNAKAAEPDKMIANQSPLPITLPEKREISRLDVCANLDLTIDENQKQCMNLKFEFADRDINETYTKLYKNLAASEKLTLKKEQINWIREKEKKCAQVEAEFQGGTFGITAQLGCMLQMTEDRLLYLKGYK